MSATRVFLIGTALAFAVTACSPGNEPGGTVAQANTQLKGEVRYMQRIALPPDAVLTVTIEDVSLADAPSVIVAQTVIHTNGRQVPLPFAIDFDPAKIMADRRYAVRAAIHNGDGMLFWTTDTHLPFTLASSGDPLVIDLVQATSSQPVDSDAEGEGVPPMAQPQMKDSDWLAVGNEPGWRIELKEGGFFNYLGDYGATSFIAAAGEIKRLEDGTRQWKVTREDTTLTLSLKEKPCQDDMAGTRYPLTAKLQINDRRLRGCARPVNQIKE